ncbi:MAG TPA: MBL fold metallo-hydrolase [Tepidisphaeraceae bacterium]|jgi:Cft2 family RNA processing exonuclease|nr:MBL fold metallo-hydrolase [Tepidisphaeraceae bacterium]
MLQWDDDLRVGGTDLWLDGRVGRGVSFVSHAHSDHIAVHGRSIATPATAALAQHRLGEMVMTEVPYGEWYQFDAETRLKIVPAGHVLGSGMILVERGEDQLLYTGDFTLQRALTAEPALVCRADELVMETTYGLPLFRFPERKVVVEQLLEIVEGAFRQGRQPIVLGYSLGKAQEITRILTDAGHAVTLHGAILNLTEVGRKHGLEVGKVQKYLQKNFHGAAAMDLRERGILVAPPYVARTSFVSAFQNPVTIMMTGWALLKGAKFRYGVDHCLPLSDHADFAGLVEMVERVGPKKVWTHHGYVREFAEYLRGRGIEAEPAKGDGQMMFGW